jgi:hypothetical protein
MSARARHSVMAATTPAALAHRHLTGEVAVRGLASGLAEALMIDELIADLGNATR